MEQSSSVVSGEDPCILTQCTPVEPSPSVTNSQSERTVSGNAKTSRKSIYSGFIVPTEDKKKFICKLCANEAANQGRNIDKSGIISMSGGQTSSLRRHLNSYAQFIYIRCQL